MAKPPQLPLPRAPRLDKYGLHAHECECGRCALGYRPTIANRFAAVSAYERRERLQKEKAARDALPRAKEVKSQQRAMAEEAARKATDEMIARLSAPVERPATPDELAEMRREFPSLRRRKDPR